MTENPLYRRVYGQDNPLLQQQIWRTPSEYYPQMNLNQNAAQDLRNLFGNFFTRNAVQNYSPQYQQPTPYQTTPYQGNYNSYQGMNIPPNQQAINQYVQNEVAPAAVDFATQQAVQKGLWGAAGIYGLGKFGKDYAPYVMAWMGANNLTKPIADGINKFAQTPVGKTIGKYADKVIDWLW